MIAALITFLAFLQNPSTDHYQQSANSFLASSLPDQTLTFKSCDVELLNATVFHLLNQQRQQKKLDSLSFSASLKKVAANFQNQLEFRTFSNAKKIESKVNSKLLEQTKKSGFLGGLVLGIVAQDKGINYDGKSDFFFDKTDDSNEFSLYYGTLKQKREGIALNLISNFTYRAFAQNLIKNLPSETTKQLQSKSYQNIGIQLQWHYKSIGKNQIPQIKLLCILGGFQTIGIRK